MNARNGLSDFDINFYILGTGYWEVVSKNLN